MSTLNTNSIGKYSGNNISIDDPLRFKTYTTTQRDALSGSAAGDTIYNSTTETLEYYNGTAWVKLYDPTLEIQYLVVGGGSGASSGVGGGSGGGGVNAGTTTSLALDTSYTVTVGAGGAAGTNNAK